MNIHFIPDSVFARDYISFLSKNFNNYKVYVYFNQKAQYVNGNNNNVEIIERFYGKYLDDVNEDKIIIHSFYDNRVIRFLLKNQYKINFKKVIMVIWGADLYNNHFILQDHKLHLKVRIDELLKKSVIKKCMTFMTFASPDFDLLCKLYRTQGKQFDCLYPSSINRNKLDELIVKNRRLQSKNIVRILLGNSATTTNNHIEMLNMLSKFKDEDIEIYCPLSYGDMEYAKYVEKYATDLYGTKFFAVKEYMKAEKYSDFLNKMDIAIFNNTRQQATANIEILGYLGKKIFIRSDSTMWGQYCVRDGCKIYDAIKINDLSFDKFVHNENNDIDYNRDYFGRIWNEEYIYSLWKNVLDYNA